MIRQLWRDLKILKSALCEVVPLDGMTSLQMDLRSKQIRYVWEEALKGTRFVGIIYSLLLVLLPLPIKYILIPLAPVAVLLGLVTFPAQNVVYAMDDILRECGVLLVGTRVPITSEDLIPSLLDDVPEVDEPVY